MADRKCFGGGVHGKVGMDNAIDLGGGDNRPRAAAIERDRQFRLPPQQRKKRDNQPGALRGASLLDVEHQNAGLRRELKLHDASALEPHRLSGQPQVGAPDAAMLDEAARHPARGVGRNREAQVLRRLNHRRVHAHHLAP